ncbi:hypothetical protein 2050H1_142 [Serratia phage 2050H1]|uniref:Uncharacterized protein n=1 Tax=Serratia phage 2050H1 TaxID=2024250 RepID=A0A249Y2J4_9CAUD|nr:hypothetical protein 2050H1_142 [Serratia phage 2050H1]
MNTILKNPQQNFGCMPLPNFEFCRHAVTKEEIFGLPLHEVLAKEVYASVVDVVVDGVGVIGKVSEVRITPGSRWFRLDTTDCADAVFNNLRLAVMNRFPEYTRPWLVSEHLNFLNPKIEIFVDEIVDEQSGMTDHVVSYLLIKGIIL